MSEHFNEYRFQQHFEGRRRQLMEEARQARLKSEVLSGARRQNQARLTLRFRVPNLLAALRAALQADQRLPSVQDCAGLENPALPSSS